MEEIVVLSLGTSILNQVTPWTKH